MPQAGQNVTALVIGNELTGEAVLHSTAGMIRLQPGTVLPVGSQVTFEVTQITPPPTPLPTAPTTTSVSPAPLTELARQWGSMQQIFTLLAGRTQTTPDDPQPTPHATLPWMPTVGAALSPNAPPSQNISAGLMMFLTALRAGNFRNWLGKDNANWLDSQGHTDLLMKAQGEFLGIARQFTEAQPSHWQPLFFPVAVEGVLQQVRMFVKRDRKEGGGAQAERKGEETRFVVEMDLTQLGEMQMDGFVRAREQHVQFDLMIRSLTPLSPEIQQNILQIYNDTGELTGYRGSLVFQAVKEFPVNPMEEIVAHTMKSVTV